MRKPKKSFTEMLLKNMNSDEVYMETEEERAESEILTKYGWNALCEYVGEDIKPIEVKIWEKHAKEKAQNSSC